MFNVVSNPSMEDCHIGAYLVSLVGSSSSNLALLSGCKFSQVAVVVTLPAIETHVSK